MQSCSRARAFHALPGFYPFAHIVPVLEVSLLHFSIQRPPTLCVLQDGQFTCFRKPILMPPVPCSDPSTPLLPSPGVSNTALMMLENSDYLSVSPTQAVQVLEAKMMYFVCTPRIWHSACHTKAIYFWYSKESINTNSNSHVNTALRFTKCFHKHDLM